MVVCGRTIGAVSIAVWYLIVRRRPFEHVSISYDVALVLGYVGGLSDMYVKLCALALVRDCVDWQFYVAMYAGCCVRLCGVAIVLGCVLYVPVSAGCCTLI